MDKLDVSLLELLKEDSRMSIEDLAAATQSHRNTITKRINNMKKNNIILRYTIDVVHHNLFNHRRLIFISIKNANIEKRKQLLEIIKKCKLVKECHKVTGRYDFVCKLMHNADEEFSIFEDSISQIPGLHTETFDIIETY